MFDIETEHRDVDLGGHRADVYKNIREDCLSIMSREPGDNYGTVIDHADFVLLTDVEFVVQPAGLERARETGQKNVHAMVRGEIDAVGADAEIEWNLMVRMFDNDICNVTYDPFETDGFEVEQPVRVEQHDMVDGDQIYGAEYAAVTTAGVGAMLPA